MNGKFGVFSERKKQIPPIISAPQSGRAPSKVRDFGNCFPPFVSGFRYGQQTRDRYWGQKSPSPIAPLMPPQPVQAVPPKCGKLLTSYADVKEFPGLGGTPLKCSLAEAPPPWTKESMARRRGVWLLSIGCHRGIRGRLPP